MPQLDPIRRVAAKRREAYDKRWEQYLLQGEASTLDQDDVEKVAAPALGSGLAGVIDSARRQIAAAAGVSISAVKVTVDFGGDGFMA